MTQEMNSLIGCGLAPPKRCNLFSLSSGALHPVYAAAASCSLSFCRCKHNVANSDIKRLAQRLRFSLTPLLPLPLERTVVWPQRQNASETRPKIPPWKIKAKSSRWGCLSIPNKTDAVIESRRFLRKSGQPVIWHLLTA
jgi:hypothetical protein